MAFPGAAVVRAATCDLRFAIFAARPPPPPPPPPPSGTVTLAAATLQLPAEAFWARGSAEENSARKAPPLIHPYSIPNRLTKRLF